MTKLILLDPLLRTSQIIFLNEILLLFLTDSMKCVAGQSCIQMYVLEEPEDDRSYIIFYCVNAKHYHVLYYVQWVDENKFQMFYFIHFLEFFEFKFY